MDVKQSESNKHSSCNNNAAIFYFLLFRNNIKMLILRLATNGHYFAHKEIYALLKQ